MIKAIICVDKQGAIGQNGDIPWGRSFPRDLSYFKKVTLWQNVLMGGNTFRSLPFKLGLPDRNNYVLTNSAKGFILSDKGNLNMDNDYSTLIDNCSGDIDLWIIGGASIYEQFADLIDEWHITTIDNVYPDADTFFQIDLTNFEDTLQCTQVGNDEVDAGVKIWRRKV